MIARAATKAAIAAFSLILSTAAPVAAHPDQHADPVTDHLVGSGDWGKVEHIATAEVTQTDDLVADVAVSPDGRYAYLANWGEPDCAGPETGGRTSPDAGAWIVDISDLSNPTQVGFIPTPQDTRPGEGMHVVTLSTKWFSGQLLAMNAEGCGKNYKGGFMLYDVTNPSKPVQLRVGVGERTRSDAHQTHSVFVWQHGDRAFLVAQDEEDLADVDIYDITNPRRPQLLTELDLNAFGVAQPELNLADSNLHDMLVTCHDDGPYAGRCILLASYWDGGYALFDVTRPESPVFIGDTDFAPVDPELREQAGISLTPEGNAHQAEFTTDGRFIIAADEDFSPYRARVVTDDGGVYDAGEFGWTVPVNELYGTLNGPTVFGGYGCATAGIPDASTLTLAAGEEAILVLQRGPLGDPSQSIGACFFSNKVETAQELGYDAVVIANHHNGALGGEGPDSYFCGGKGHEFTVEISALCIGHRAMHELFDDPDAADDFTYPESVPAVGTVGDRLTVTSQFDGWGYVHLFDAETLEELDTFAIPEAMDPAYASGFGDLSVHEVAVDPLDPSMAYLSYYAGGLRAVQIQCADPADTSTCELVEVGGYLDPEGNDFWGVETLIRTNPVTGLPETIILASDRDTGLWIFRDP